MEKRSFSSTSLFEVKVVFGCDFDANLILFWKDFGRPGGGSGRLLGRLGGVLEASWAPKPPKMNLMPNNIENY